MGRKSLDCVNKSHETVHVASAFADAKKIFRPSNAMNAESKSWERILVVLVEVPKVHRDGLHGMLQLGLDPFVVQILAASLNVEAITCMVSPVRDLVLITLFFSWCAYDW